MTIYRTCHGCRFEATDCQTRSNFARRIALLGITSVKWKCIVRQPMYQPGDPVFAKTTVEVEGERKATFRATVIRHTAGRNFLIFIRPGTLCEETEQNWDARFVPMNGGRGFCRLSVRNLKPRIGDPPIDVCSSCNTIPSVHGHMPGCERAPL